MQAYKEVTEKLKQSLEIKLEKSNGDISQFEKELNLMRNKLAEAEDKLKKKKRLLFDKKTMKELKKKVIDAIIRRRSLEEGQVSKGKSSKHSEGLQKVNYL